MSIGPSMRLERSFVSQWLIDSVPDWVRAWVAGPATILHLTSSKASVRNNVRRGRPVDIDLDQERVLSGSLSLPHEARRDWREAVALWISSETPFQPAELLVCVRRVFNSSHPEHMRLKIDMVPVDDVNEALRDSGIHPRLLRSVRIVESDGNVRQLAFQLRSWRSSLWRIAWIAAPAILLLLLCAMELGRLTSEAQVEATQLEAQADKMLAELRPLQAELDGRQAALNGRQAFDDMLSRSPSAFKLLNELKKALPRGVAVDGIQLDRGALRVAVHSPNILETVRSLNNLKGWGVSTVGSVTTDSTTGQDVATLSVTMP